MVASVSALTSAAQAASYYEADDYYSEDGLAPSQWRGQGAQALGLSGEVDRERFREALDGKIGNQMLGTMRGGELEHRPGWDVTLSAPKSVSIMAEVAGDRRLIAAHDEAVSIAMAHVERHMAATRIRDGGSVARESTGNLVIASFQHGTSRAQDPQLHTHNVVMNATQSADGEWRSLEPRAIYQLQKQIGSIYRQELSVKVRELGYQIETAKGSMFEIAGVPAEVLEAFSTRSAQIEAALAERGASRDTASAAQKQVIALDTRETKFFVDQGALVADWRETASDAGFRASERLAIVAAAEAKAADPAYLAALARQGHQAAFRAIAQASAHLGERQSVFSHAALQAEAGRFSLGKASHAQIASAIAEETRGGALIDRTFLDRRGAKFDGFTTRRNVETETTLLRVEAQGRGACAPIASPLEAAKAVGSAAMQAERAGFAWNVEQREATTQLLTSRNRITAIQGFAGTAKTTTVLATFAREAGAKGLSVVALAPTSSAAMVLGEALETRSDTVARHLRLPERPDPTRPVLWIVDEASLLSAQDTAQLFDLAEKHHARIVLVGDVQQLGSVAAGAAFEQLQQAGMETAKLTEIVRQTNEATKEAVLASIQGDAQKALAALDRGGGTVIEHEERAARFAMMATRYTAMDEVARARTLVVEPSREGRDRLIADIREALSEAGAITGPAVPIQRLDSKGLTRADAHDPMSYNKGDVIRFFRDYQHKGVMRGEAYTVESIDAAKAAIMLRSEDGREVDWRLRQWGASHVQAFAPQAMDLKTGDAIRFTRNDREAGRNNGTLGAVIALDAQNRTATVRTERGKVQTLDLDAARDRHIAHAYVSTTFTAQGRTVDHIIVHADSAATNLVDQKSFYTKLSRAKAFVTLFTNDRARLEGAIAERTGEKQTALVQHAAPNPAARKDFGAGLG
ncbi:MobF family relaxase [Stakelama pacifica]|uniref:Conjugative relaxase-like TrwC/TraI family protein n=1 Tax=Stakelama pacifica TaxID=517720 RepID=A0A4R6FZA5_9SPHN|nr:MobF family relaxase [Stakelama pacifica]TDN86475.1 conjugative relaxase-like TrwC/TraI family protein [Stakelama pacifica]GGO89760.1 conjugative relaxase [Stakelama pacifica]